VGAWSDGAENSIMLSWSGENPAVERAALAMEGYIADQKSVLYFQPDTQAEEFIARFTAEGDVVAVHEDLLKRGLAFHTLRPTSEGTVVYVYGQDQETLDKVGDAAKAHNAEMSWTPGKGEFIGTKLENGEATDREQRDDARRVYEDEISRAAGGEVGHVWEDIRDRWTRRLQQSQDQEVGDFNPNHDPDTGEFSSGEGGGGGGDFTVASPAQRVQYKANRAGKIAEYDPRFFTHRPLVLEYEGKPLDMGRDELVRTAPYNADLSNVPTSPDIIYRGMSAGEFDAIQKTGEIRGSGEYNIGEQQRGLTYYGADPQIAQSYASSFAPRKYKPSWDRPAYVVAIRRPPPELIRQVSGVGENEVGVVGAVPADDIVAVYRGDVIAYVPEEHYAGGSTSAMVTLNWSQQALPPRKGGDGWNRATGTRLESEYDASRAAVAATVHDLGVAEPEQLDPLSQRSNNDSSTHQFATALVEKHAAKVMSERLARPIDPAAVHAMGSRLWSDWLDSTALTKGGKLLQLAAAEELGGRFDERRMIGSKLQELVEAADKEFADVGGYAGVKAYVRGMWETTQYLLERSGMNDVGVYRSIWQRPEERGRSEEFAHGAQRWTRLPDTLIRRNGMASFSAASSMASSWGQGDRTVIRAKVPRTAIVSIPAYGGNDTDEMELTVAGTAWHGWDAWLRSAPDFNTVPLVEPPDKIKDEAAPPAASTLPSASAGAPAENQSLQPVNDPKYRAIDLQRLDTDWLRPAGRARARLARDDVSGSFASKQGSWLMDPETGELIGSSSEEGGGGGESAAPARAATLPKAAKTKAAKATTSPAASPPKKIEGVKADSHPAKISPSYTKTNKRTVNSEDTYVPTGLATMAKHEHSYSHNIALHANAAHYPGLRAEDTEGTNAVVARNIVDRMKSNLRYLWTKATAAQKTAANWYRGANSRIRAKATQYKLDSASVAGVYAALSPTKDWEENIYLADRVLDIYHTKQHFEWTQEMSDTAERIWLKESSEKDSPERQASIVASNAVKTAQWQRLRAAKTLSALTSHRDMAMWIRTYDETYGDPEQEIVSGVLHGRGYREFLPDGTLGGFRMTQPQSGNPEKALVTWQSMTMTANAIEAMLSGGDRHIISAAVGERHKVRNFYNNLVDPDGTDGDVTIDSHAVGGAWMMPTSGVEVAKGHALATSPGEGAQNAKNGPSEGIWGTYGFYADAYRELAGELHMLPDELQAVLWVVKRDAFVDMAKQAQVDIRSMWQSFHNGDRSLAETHDAVWRIVEEDQQRKRDAAAARSQRTAE
jgi:hypothetical protein